MLQQCKKAFIAAPALTDPSLASSRDGSTQ